MGSESYSFPVSSGYTLEAECPDRNDVLSFSFSLVYRASFSDFDLREDRDENCGFLSFVSGRGFWR